MSADKLSDAITEIVRAVADELLDAKLPGALAQQAQAATADTEEARELRRICALEYLTKYEAAQFLNVSESHIDNLIADDVTFPVHRVGAKNVRLRRLELIEWTRQQGRKRLRRVG
jgi:excisionase family DNA binding protein